jgi:hypothetical protein
MCAVAAVDEQDQKTMGEQKSSFEMFKEIVQGQLDKLRVINERQWQRIQELLTKNGELELEVIRLKTELLKVNRQKTIDESSTREDRSKSKLVVAEESNRGRTRNTSSKKEENQKSNAKKKKEQQRLTEEALQKFQSNEVIMETISDPRGSETYISE